MAAEVGQDTAKDAVPISMRVSKVIQMTSVLLSIGAVGVVALSVLLNGDLRTLLTLSAFAALFIASKKAKSAPIDLRPTTKLTPTQSVLAAIWGKIGEIVVPKVMKYPNATRNILSASIALSSAVAGHFHFDLDLIPASVVYCTLPFLPIIGIVSLYAFWFHFDGLVDWTFKTLPAGPVGLPFYGVVLEVNEFKSFLKVNHKAFGDILSFNFGNVPYVSLSNYEHIREAAKGQAFKSRPMGMIIDNLMKGAGIINTNGSLWRGQRNFLMKQKMGMRTGGNVDSLKHRIQAEALGCAISIGEYQLQSMNLEPVLSCYVANVISSLAMSTRFRHTDTEFQKFMGIFDEGFEIFNALGPVDGLPTAMHLKNTREKVDVLRKNRNTMLAFVRKIVEDHAETLDEAAPRDLVDTYLIEAKNNPESFHGVDPMEQTEQILLDLFSAGSETVRTTIMWAVVYMLHNPTHLKDVQAELDAIVGVNSMPTFDDMEHLPVTRATLYEIQRMCNTVPIGVPHTNEKATTIGNHYIPAGTQLFMNTSLVHSNPEYFPEPEKFNPGRFLNETRTKVSVPKQFIPFGTGQRVCLGDELARKELFMFFATLVHSLDFEAVRDSKGDLPKLDGILAVTHKPHEFEVIVKPRKMAALIAAQSELERTIDLPHTNLFNPEAKAVVESSEDDYDPFTEEIDSEDAEDLFGAVIEARNNRFAADQGPRSVRARLRSRSGSAGSTDSGFSDHALPKKRSRFSSGC